METPFYAPALSGFFNVMFDRMLDKDFLNFLTCRGSTKELVTELRGKMVRIDKLLGDAEEKQTADESVKSWLDEVKDAFYAAEDLVDRIYTEVSHHKTRAETPLGAALGSRFLENVDSDIRDIYQRFVNLEGEIADLGFKEGQAREPSTCFVDESVIVGRDNKKYEIITFLLRKEICPTIRIVKEDSILRDSRTSVQTVYAKGGPSAPPVKKFRIVAITGLPGVGKTTLAQLVYNDKQLQSTYSLKAWVCVSEAHGDVRQITKTILKSISSCSSDPKSDGPFHGNEDLNSLQCRLLERLLKSENDFFILLDDVLDMRSKLWDDLIIPLKSVATGGTILMTTNNSRLVERMQPDLTINLEKLSDEDCWRVVEQHAFQSRQDCKVDKRMEDIARKLALKCNGLPLAARMVGRLLDSTRPEKWEGILDSDAWLQEDILPALLLSYNYLPSYLKRCFVYCSMFPESYIFEKETIVRLWIAEGFVGEQNRSLPQVSDDYFDELVSRSFFQQSNSNKSHFIMHSLIHALARYVYGEFSYSLEDHICRESTRQINRVLPHRTRYLSYLQKEYDTFGRFSEALSGVKSLRTFLARTSSDSDGCFLSKDVLDHLANRFVCSMRVLSLSHYKITGRHLSNIHNLMLLRFLDLSYTSIDNLPESVCTLVNLQTLLVSDCRNLTRLPDSIGDLKKLLYLDLSRTKISEFPCSIVTLPDLQALFLSECPISMLPAKLGNLISLRHLDLSKTKLQHMPEQIGKLSRLQTLTNFFVGRNGAAIQVLRDLKCLKGSLHISILDDVSIAEGSENILQDLGLDRLDLEWPSQNIQQSGEKSRVLDLLLPNPRCIENILIKYYYSNLPTRLLDGTFDKLVSLTLGECIIPRSWGEKFGLLCLKHLCLTNLKFDDSTDSEDFTLANPKFLETLRIEGFCVRTLRLQSHTWAPEMDLHLRNCPELRTINWEGRWLMKKLEIVNCKKLCFEYYIRCRSLILQECDALFSMDVCSFPFYVSESLHIGYQLHDICNVINFDIYSEELTISDYARALLLRLPTQLKSLSISRCRSLEIKGDTAYLSLRHLSIIRTSYNPSTTFHFDMFENLVCLEIKGCLGLASISTIGVVDLPYLSIVSISDCPELLEFHGEHLPAPNLATLSICGCQRLKSLPANMCTSLYYLQSLSIDDCPQIDSLPAGGFPPCLHSLCVKNCPRLMPRRAEWRLQELTCLRKLEIEGCDNTISFPEEDWLPASITHLKISAFRNLKSLAGTELYRLTSLQALEIRLCWNLQALPQKMPLSLCYLEIMGCKNLAERCQRNEGRDWPKISHLLGIIIDGMDI